MSTQPVDAALAAKLAGLMPLVKRKAEVEAEIVRGTATDPLSYGRLLPWQRVARALVAGDEWMSEWGPKPTRKPSLVCVVSANRTGKSVFAGRMLAEHAQGRMPRFPRPGEVWGGMPTLAASVATMRAHVERWVGRSNAKWYPREGNSPAETLIRAASGWIARLKAYEQGREHWYAGKCQMVVLDEPPPDEIVSEARTRLIDEDGIMLAVFTALQGTDSVLFRECYEPWQALKAKGHAFKWGEVAPGKWLVSVGMRDNAQSVGGFLPDHRIDEKERELVEAGKALEARVAIHGEWLDIAEDAIIPHVMLQQWSAEPRGGFARIAAWIDPAYTAKTSSCESAIAIWAADHDGKLYQIESQHGRWESAERLNACADLLVAYGCPDTGIQRTPGDVVFMDELNRELMRRGQRACVRPFPEKGAVPDKITRAHQFAPMVANGQVFIRPEHVEFKRQAQRLSVAFIKSGGLVDVVDAGIGAALMLVEHPGAMDLADNLRAMHARIRPEDPDDDSPVYTDWQSDRDLFDLNGSE